METPLREDPPYAVSDTACRNVGEVLKRVGDRWSMLIVMMLAAQPRRFNELRRDIPEISQRMLALTLRGLERDGLVSRTVTSSIPPRVDYALTELAAIIAWASRGARQLGQSHGPAIATAQTLLTCARQN